MQWSFCITKSAYAFSPLLSSQGRLGTIGVCGEASGKYKKNGWPGFCRAMNSVAC